MINYYVFDPQHPARAEQVMQRVRVEGWKLVIERGTFAGWEVVESKRVLRRQRAKVARLLAAHEQGLRIAFDPIDVLTRLSARHPELLAAIQAIDDLDSSAGRAALEVYADFLQAEGDARGVLAALQLRDPNGRDALEWLDCQRAQIFGPLAELEDATRLPKLRWQGGWITEVVQRPRGASSRSGDPPAYEVLENVLRLPATACLRRLQGPWVDIHIAFHRCSATPRCLVIEELMPIVVDYSDRPKLDELVLDIRDGFPKEVRLASARPTKLFVDADQLTDVSAFLDTVSVRPLERFGFRISWGCEPTHLRVLLSHAALRSVREISLAWDPRDGYDDVMLRALLEAPLLHRIELRDFSRVRVGDPQQILDAFASAPGRTITRP